MKDLIKYHEDKYKYWFKHLLEFRNQRIVAKKSNEDYYYSEVAKSVREAKNHRKWVKELKLKNARSNVVWTPSHQSYHSAGDEAECFCENCETYLYEGDKFCRGCGVELNWEVEGVE